MLDLAAGQVSFVFSTLPTALPFVTSGRIRALAVSGLKRNAAPPEVPTVAESALPGFNVNAWLGLMAAGSTPAATIERLHAAAVKSLQRPEVRKRLEDTGAEVVGGTPAQMAAHLKSEMDRWVRLAKEVKFERAD